MIRYNIPYLLRQNVLQLRGSIIALLSIGVVLSSCDSFFDVNDNPNQPISANLSLSAKLPAALVSTVNQETGQINQIGAFWGGYWGTNNDGANLFFDLKTYNGPGIRSQREGIPVWENGYNNILYFRLIQEEAEQTGELFYAGTAKIMQGWLFLRLVDFYNNIPFEDAAKGTEINNPRYENGSEVYHKAINFITEGIQDIKVSGTVPANSGDLLFQANKLQWYKFANTVKLRALIRQSQTGNSGFINEEISKIVQEGSGFLGYGESAFVQPGYLNTNGKLNPFWETYYRDVQGNSTANHQNIRPTEYVLEQYQIRNDPRLHHLYQAVNGEFKGVIFGNPDAGNPRYSNQNTSAFKGPLENNGLGTGLFDAYNQPSVLMADFESLFLQAEAAERGWLGGSPKNFYEEAIKASFNYLNVEENEFGIYNSQELINFDLASDKIERIITQKWLAMNSISSIEAWNDFRRLGIPDFPSTLATGVNGRPLRLMYPETERGTNNENASAQGGDLMDVDKVWWDKD